MSPKKFADKLAALRRRWDAGDEVVIEEIFAPNERKALDKGSPLAAAHLARLAAALDAIDEAQSEVALALDTLDLVARFAVDGEDDAVDEVIGEATEAQDGAESPDLSGP